MKKTVIINISGIIFHIDEDAFDKLNIYLDTLKRYFGSNAEGQEIIGDIESRIAELLQPKISETKQSITIEDIEEIIAILGKPEDIAGAEEETKEKMGEPETSYSNQKGSRRLYRDPDNSVISGVCGGMGAYFNVDPILFRLIFVGLVFAVGTSIIIYIILWIAVPLAQSAAQKLEMRGENVNVSNIERKIKEEYDHLSNNIKKQDIGSKIGNFIHEIFSIFGKVIMLFLNIIKFFAAGIFILIALAFIIAIISGFFFSNFAFHEPLISSFSSIQDFLNNIIDPFTANFLLFLAIIIILLPCVSLIYWGLKIIIRFKAKDKMVSVALFLVWFGAVITMVAMIFNQISRYKYESSVNENLQLTTPSKNIFYIQAIGKVNTDDDYFYHANDQGIFGIDHTGNKNEIISPVRIYLERTDKTAPYIEIVKKGRGMSDEDALEQLKLVKVNAHQADTIIYIDPFFRLPNGERWKFNRTKIILHVPEGMNIQFDRKIKPYVHDIYNDWDNEDQLSDVWQMTAKGMDISQQKIVDEYTYQNLKGEFLHIELNEKFPVSEFSSNNSTRNVTYSRNGVTYTVTTNIHDEKYQNIEFDRMKYKFGLIDFKVEKSNDQKIHLEIIKSIINTNTDKAEKFAKKIRFDFNQKDSVITIDPIYLFPENGVIPKHKVMVKLSIPESSKLYLDKSLKSLDKINEYDLGKPLEMNEDGDLQVIY